MGLPLGKVARWHIQLYILTVLLVFGSYITQIHRIVFKDHALENQENQKFGSTSKKMKRS